MATIDEVEGFLAQSGEVYLVGSAIWLPGVAADHDYALAGDTLAVGRRAAALFHGKCVVMDAERRHARLALPRVGVLDLAPLMGGSLATDLAGRDFTLNAVATAVPGRRPLYDPFRGLTDLRYRLVRQVSAGALFADPLRVLRAVRLLSERGFVIEDGTLDGMAAAAPGLKRVQPERLHGELSRAFSAPGWHAAALLLLDLEAWPALPVAGPIRPHEAQYRALVAGLRAGEERLAAAPPPAWAGHGERVQGRLTGVLAAAMLASAMAPPAMAEAARALRCTRGEVGEVEAIGRAYAAITGGHADAAALADDYRAASLTAAGMAGRMDLLAGLLALHDAPAWLPTGAALHRRLHRPPGPWLGAVLRDLRRAALRGELHSEDDAWQLAAALARRDNGADAEGAPPKAPALETGDDAAG